MSFVAVAVGTSAAVGAYGAYESGKAAEEAAETQAQAARAGQTLTREAQEQLRQDVAPFRAFGGAALDPLAQRLGFGGFQQNIDLPGSTAQLDLERQQQADQRQRVIDYYRTEWGIQNPTEQQIFDATTQAGIEDQRKHNKKPFTTFANENPLPDRRSEMVASTSAFAGRGGQFAPDPKMQRFTRPGSPDQPVGQAPEGFQRSPLLQQAMQERAAYDPMSQGLLARAQQERMEFDPLQNKLLQSAAQKQMAFDPAQAMSPEILQNPLLRAMQEDVTRRLMANQAARGKLGSGGTAEALQQRLVPQAIEFGLQLNELQRQDIADRARLGGAQVALQEGAMGGREQLGFNLEALQRQAISDRLAAGTLSEDINQRDIANLMDAVRMGQASAARVGASGTSAASEMGQLGQQAAQAQAAGTLAQAQARNQMMGSLAQGGLGLLGSFQRGLGSGSGTATGMNTGITQGYQPTAQQHDQYLGF